MLKKVMLLVALALILCVLILIKTHTSTPVNNISSESSSSSEYTKVEYKIININGNDYYGKGADGTEIHFSANKILSGVTIHVNDQVICYFDKYDLGKGLVKVEKK